MMTQALRVDEMCGTAGNTDNHNDLNMQWTCHRNALAYQMITWQADIDRTKGRLAKARNPRVIKNLTEWVADQEARKVRIMAQITADNHACTCK